MALIAGWTCAPPGAFAEGPPVAAYSFDEGEGETARDSAGNHDAILHGAEWTEEGKYGGALHFDGESAYLSVPDSDELDFTDGFTLEAWVRPDSSRTDAPIITKETSNFYSYRLEAGGELSGLPEGFISDGAWSWEEVAAEEALPNETWSHLAFTYNGEELRLYVDGELIDTDTAPNAQVGNGPLKIGGNHFEDFFEGTIDEVQIDNAALSFKEINEDMNTALAPTNVSLPEIPSTPYETLDVRADAGDWLGTKPISFEYQWRRCNSEGEECIDIEGATKEFYAPESSDVGHRLRVRVQAVSEAGSAVAESNRSPKVLHSPPIFLQAVGIKGTPKEGYQLESDLSGLRGSPSMSISYEWLRCDEICSAIPAASESTYTLTSSDVTTRILLKVLVENEFGTTNSTSPVTDPVEPAETTGAPRLAERPRLLGLYRVTDKMGSTTGDWRGSSLIATTLKWQRCTPDLEKCEDIEGATSQLYEPTAEDEGMRLKTLVEAENGLGNKIGESIASPPILPAFNTVFQVENEATLEAVAKAIDEAGVPLLSLVYGGKQSGIYSGSSVDPSTLVDEISERLEGDASELPVENFMLRGGVSKEALGDLETDVEPFEVPSLHAQSDPEISTAKPGVSFVESVIDRAKIQALGPTTEYDAPEGPLPPPPLVDRAIYTKFTWNVTPEQTLEHLEDVGSSMAMEFDIKLQNKSNTNVSVNILGVPLQGICLPWETNNFWIDDRNTVLIMTNIPGEAGLYWDTDASDSCQTKDLTYGIYHPEALDSGGVLEGVYSTHVYFGGDDAAGQTGASEVNAAVQLLGEHCDFSPYCVNIPHLDVEGETMPILEEKDYYLPGCYTFLNRATATPKFIEELIELGQDLSEAFGVEPCAWIT